MCGRYDLTATPAQLEQEYAAALKDEYLPSYNIFPSKMVLAIRDESSSRAIRLHRWGLITHWTKTAQLKNDTKNAVGETLADKPTFREAFKRHRCIVPATGFYEWQKKTKQPYRIVPVGSELLSLAGLYTTWRGSDGQVIETCTIVTTTPNAVMEPLHHRMPVILSPDDYEAWLGANSSTEKLHQLLRPCPDSILNAYEVSRYVNSPSNDTAECIDPFTPESA